MFKKVLPILMILILSFSVSAFASGMSFQYYPPADSDFYGKKFTEGYYISSGVKSIRFTQHPYGDTSTEYAHITFDVNPNSTIYFDYTCKGAVSVEYLDSTGTVIASDSTYVRGQTDSYIFGTTCSQSGFVIPSDYDTNTNQYKNDTFGGTKNKSTLPTNDYVGNGGVETSTTASPVLGVSSSTVPVSDGNTEAKNLGFPVTSTNAGSPGTYTSSGSTGTKTNDDLYNALEDVKTAVQGNGSVLNSILSSENSNGQTLSSILDQMSNSSVGLHSGSVPSSSVPSSDGRLDRNKPAENTAYHDSTWTFTDQADDPNATSDTLPLAGDPVACWGDTCKQADPTLDGSLTVDVPLNADSVQIPDNPLSQDIPLAMDNPLNVDSQLSVQPMSSDVQMNQDAEMSSQAMNQDTEMSSQAMNQDAELNQTNSQTQNNFYNQDPELTVTN
jgi:hypothetical protein